MRVQCDKCLKRMRRVEHLCRRVAFSSGMDSKTHSTTCTTSNATSVAHLLLLLPLPLPPCRISHSIPQSNLTSAHPCPLTPARHALSCGTWRRIVGFYDTEGRGGGGEVVGLLVALFRHLRAPPGKRLPAALSKEGLQQCPRLVEAWDCWRIPRLCRLFRASVYI